VQKRNKNCPLGM